jgi:23S rRNA G2069 N7-methylase RlmK/C1962 C5-methylase RlmI
MQNLNRLQPYLTQNGISAYRLLGNSFRWPAAVDIYQDQAVVHIFEKVAPDFLVALRQSLEEQLKIRGFHYKNRSHADLELPSGPPCELIQSEYGHRFKLNLADYMDTGLFLDHRETRRWLAEQSRDKVVLNTFAYTGSFSIYAGAAGARQTYSVDLSRVYCDWTKQNLELNALPGEKNWVIKMDALEYFQYACKRQLYFDIIIIDPPTFSRNKGASFSVQRDHPVLIRAALDRLTDSGFILFSTNFQDFQIKTSALGACRVTEKKDTVPPDFAGTQPHRVFIISH